jgi:hypothetical protein
MKKAQHHGRAFCVFLGTLMKGNPKRLVQSFDQPDQRFLALVLAAVLVTVFRFASAISEACLTAFCTVS